jgi:glycosyltransferase involved in cell wall biosynthesis
VSGERVLRVYHSAVVGEYRERDRLLRERHGFDVHLVAPPAWNEGGELVVAEPDSRVPIDIVDVRGPKHPILFWYQMRAFRRVLRRLRPAIVDLHEEPYSLSVAAALGAVKAEAPGAAVCVYSAQNIFKRYPPPFRQLERRALKRASAAYPCSSEAGVVLRRKRFSGALHVLPLGVTTSDGTRVASGSARVGFVGRLEPYKGAAVAIEAFATAAINPEARLELVGAGPQRTELEALATRLGVANRVEFTGSVSQDRALERIRNFDVVVVPSLTTRTWKEQFGRVPAQAFAAGVPVIASDSGSLPEVVDGCGEIVREGRADDLARALERLLGDPARRQELAARGRTRALEEFSWERVADRHAAMYRDMIDG